MAATAWTNAPASGARATEPSLDRARQSFEHLLHDLRLQLRHLRLQGLRHRVFDYLPHFILFLVPHAREPYPFETRTAVTSARA